MTTPAVARQHAAAFFRSFAFPTIVIGNSFGELLRLEHGPFDPEKVRVAYPTYFAETAYAEVPDTVPVHIKKYLGPKYFTYYEYKGRVIGNLASSAYNTDIWVEHGRLRFPLFSGNDFRPAVLARGEAFVMPVSPERAVEIIGQATGALTTEVPRLYLAHRHFAAQFARWEVILESDVVIVGDTTGISHVTNRIYVGWEPIGDGSRSPSHYERLWVPLAEQPLVDYIPYRRPEDELGDDLLLEVKVIAPVRFETARWAQ